MLNIIIPMAGRGSRFSSAGYRKPKPFIDVCGFPMIEIVIRNLTPKVPHRFIFVVQEEHWQGYKAKTIFDRACISEYEVVKINGITEGAAQTVLCAQHLLNNDDPLMIANSDQFIAYSIDTYLKNGEGSDGFLMTMRDTDPKWSYAEVYNGKVQRVVEKKVISDIATVGIYNFSCGNLFVDAANKMIECNQRSQGEFYVAPVYTDLAELGLNIKAVSIGDVADGMFGLGTPEDLRVFEGIPQIEKFIKEFTVGI